MARTMVGGTFRPPTGNTVETGQPWPSWTGLQPELVACVAAFADVGADLTTLCRVAGPAGAAVIRKRVLLDNDDYLRYALTLDRKLSKLKVLSWMEENTDWADKFGTGAQFERGLGKSFVYAGRRNEGGETDDANRLTASQVGHLVRLRKSLGGRTSYTETNDGPFGNADAIDEGDVLLSVGDTRMGPSASLDAVGYFIAMDGASKGEVVLRFVRSGRDFIFKDPIVSIYLGLTDLLEVMLENDFVGSNELLPFKEQGPAKSLLWYSLMANGALDRSILLYLLSRDDIDCSANSDSETPGKSIIFSLYDWKVSLEDCIAIVQHQSTNANAMNASFAHGITPLLFLSWVGCNCNIPQESTVAKFKVLLEAGADSYAEDNFGNSSISYLRANYIRSDISDDCRNRVGEMLVMALGI